MRGIGRLRWAVRAAVERADELRAGISDRRPPAPVPRPRPLLVVSPHLDDAVLSCGQLLAGAPGTTVLTVFTAGSGSWDDLTEWDRSCGFRAGDDVMAARKREDRRALGVLGARPEWLGLVEGQYRQEVVATVVAALGPALDRHGDADVVVPLGLVHPDHEVVAAAVAQLLRGRPASRWWAYADLPYALQQPASVSARLAALREEGIEVELSVPGRLGDRRRKRAAIRRYPTQVRPLRGSIGLALSDERYWRMRARPGGPTMAG